MSKKKKWGPVRHNPLGAPDVLVECPVCHVTKKRTGHVWGRDPAASDGLKSICVGCQRRQINLVLEQAAELAGGPPVSVHALQNRANVRKSRELHQDRYRENWRRLAKLRRKDLSYRLYGIVKSIRYKCKAKGSPFDLDVPFLFSLLEKQNNLCAISGEPLTFTVGQGAVWTDMSVDRMDPKLGYVKSNVQIVQRIANSSKVNMDMPQFLDFCEKVLLHAGRLGWADEARCA